MMLFAELAASDWIGVIGMVVTVVLAGAGWMAKMHACIAESRKEIAVAGVTIEEVRRSVERWYGEFDDLRRYIVYRCQPTHQHPFHQDSREAMAEVVRAGVAELAAQKAAERQRCRDTDEGTEA